MNKVVHFLLSFVILGMISCQSDPIPYQSIYLVRHAEKDLSGTTKNPPLTAEGEARSKLLVDEMNAVDINLIYSTTYDRNWNTILPTAQDQNIAINSYLRYDWHGMVDSVKKATAKNILICGHGDNLYELIEAFGAAIPEKPLGKHEYDNLYEVRIYVDSAVLVTKKY